MLHTELLELDAYIIPGHLLRISLATLFLKGVLLVGLVLKLVGFLETLMMLSSLIYG